MVEVSTGGTPAAAFQPGSPDSSEASDAGLFEALLTKDSTRKQRTAPLSTPEDADPSPDHIDETQGPDDEEKPIAKAKSALEPEGDDDAEQGSEQSTEDESDGEPVGRKFTVKIDGKNVEVDEKEVVAGYQRQADYTRKTTALAGDRKAFEAEAAQVRQERQRYQQILPQLGQMLQAQLPKPPDPNLRAVDPLRYMMEKDAYESGVQQVRAVNQEMVRLNQQAQSEHFGRLQQQIDYGRQKLPELVPEWKDAAVYEADRPKLRGYLKQGGYEDSEIDQAYDPRAISLAVKAMKYDALMARAKNVKPAVSQAQTQARPRASQESASPPRRDRELNVAKQRLKETGSMDDAASAFKALL
jgi:hypothetical protein